MYDRKVTFQMCTYSAICTRMHMVCTQAHHVVVVYDMTTSASAIYLAHVRFLNLISYTYKNIKLKYIATSTRNV